MGPMESTPAASTAPPLPLSVRRPACRVTERGGAAVWDGDAVAAEYPLTLLVNGEELATLVCSPADLEDLVLGFLAAEGVIRSVDDVVSLRIDADDGTAHVEASARDGALARRTFGKRYVGSCCGKSRAGFYMANDAATARRVEADLPLRTADCFRLMEELAETSPLFTRTGGVHNAALAVPDGIEVTRVDIGRHNTLDKLHGHAVRAGLDTSRRAIVFSGRLSSEILLKVSKMGCPAILSQAAPTGLALDLAARLGVTAAGFLRGGRMNVYTHPHRIRDLPEG